MAAARVAGIVAASDRSKRTEAIRCHQRFGSPRKERYTMTAITTTATGPVNDPSTAVAEPEGGW